MTLFFRYILFPLAFLTGFAGTCGAQDLYDLPHSRKYAAHLWERNEYALAAMEYQRLLRLQPDNDTFSYRLVKAWRLGQLYDAALKKGWALADSSRPPIATEYLHLLMQGRLLAEADSFTDNYRSFSRDDSLKARLDLHMLRGAWLQAGALQPQVPFKEDTTAEAYRSVILRSDKLKYRSPLLAGSMSAIVPGSGRFYTGDWKDGLLSLGIMATSAYSAWYGFSHRGSRSVYGWVFAGIGTGFYLGNIYGSWLSAKRFNHRQHDKLMQDAENTVYSTF